MKITALGLIVALAIPAGTSLAGHAAAQQPAQDSQQDSLAAAARRSRENKGARPKAARVWDNDNIPNNPESVSVVGQDAAAAGTPSDTAASGATNAGPSAAPSPGSSKTDASAPVTSAPGAPDQTAAAKQSTTADKNAGLQAELAAAKDQLQSLTVDLDILKRKFTLDQEVYYGKPNYAADKDGAASLKDEQDQIDAKQQEIADAQKKIDDLQSRIEAAASSADKPKT
jgi:hypothetical protein